MENKKEINVSNEVLALKYLSTVFDRTPQVVAMVMQSMVDEVRDELIDSLLIEDVTEEQLDKARALFEKVESNLEALK